MIMKDACKRDVGYVLQHEQGSGEPRPVGYRRRTLIDAEKNYGTTQRESPAVVWTVLLLRPYIEGTRFIIKTDHQALKCILD